MANIKKIKLVDNSEYDIVDASAAHIQTVTLVEWNALTPEQQASGDYVVTGVNTSPLSASLIPYDNTLSGLAATTAQGAIDEVGDLIYNILPTDSANGNIANFNTCLAMPVVNTEFDINAIQESGTPTPSEPKAISGVSVVSVIHLSGNYFDKTTRNIGYLINASGTYVSYADWNVSDYVPVIEGMSYYLYGLSSHPNTNQDNFELFDENKTKTGYANVKTNEYPYIIPSGVKFVRFSVKNADIDTAQFGVYQNTSYSPYNSTLDTYIISLGGTYYGGKLIQDIEGHRQLKVTHSNLFDLGSLTWNQSTDGYCQNTSDIADMKITASGTTMPDMLCSSLVVDTPTHVYNHTTDNTISIASANSRFRVYMTSIAGYTAAEVKSALTGVYVAYPLATPTIIDLPDGTPITTIIGVNNIYADSGDTSVQFKDGVQHYIDKKIAETQALILS